MKKLLAILVLGIGIVLTIPKSVQAVDNCNVTVDGSYGFPNKIHYCNDDDEMEVSVTMTRNWALADLNSKTADDVSITITADGSMLSNKSGASAITGNGTDGATIVNAGTVRAGVNTINFNTGTNVTITNQSGGVIKAEHSSQQARPTAIKASGTGLTIDNSGDITSTGARTIIAGGTNATITNNSGGTIQASTNFAIEASGTG